MRFPLGLDDLEPGWNELGTAVVDAVVAVRRELGAGLVERVYVECLVEELAARGIPCETEVAVPLAYKGRTLRGTLRLDLLVGGIVVVEAKAVDALHPVHHAQLLTYLKLSGKPLGYLVNFNAVPLRDGIHRKVNTRQA